MKNLKILLWVLVAIITFSYCKKEENNTAVLINISVKSAPEKINYYIGDTLDLNGLEVTLVFDNGTTETIRSEDFSSLGLICSPENGIVINSIINEIKITDLETSITASQTIKVNPVTVKSISIKTPPNKIDYYERDTLDLTGMEIKLTMNNDKTEDIPFSDFLDSGILCSIPNGTILSSEMTSIAIIHTSSGLGTIQTITINNIIISEITLINAPQKIEYFEGDSLDLTGLEVAVIMNNATSKNIPFSDFITNEITCFPQNGSILDKTSSSVNISILNSDLNTTFDISVQEILITEVLVINPPNNILYATNEALNLEGLIIRLVKNNNSYQNVLYSDFVTEGIVCYPQNGTLLTESNLSVKITHEESNKSAYQEIFVKNGLYDMDGNFYNTVKIGNQVWMKENLKTTKFNNGLPIANARVSIESPEIDTASYCWYEFKNENKAIYGALYNWHAVKSGNLCPNGWHVPSDEEWSILVEFLGGEDIAGGKLKSTGTLYWKSPNTGATNESGFSALPAGDHSADGQFFNLGTNCKFATSTLYRSGIIWQRTLSRYSSSILRGNGSDKDGISVRCIKN
ncbi:FISUMP domain-containing protein [Saccharicrinis sp. FJH62]|uniref:FISUMP domain-containing protein n=1 Tax=Saccharicrinis sp. FJH62 TaxID=3344657 RepID=UPI0035D4D8E6